MDAPNLLSDRITWIPLNGMIDTIDRGDRYDFAMGHDVSCALTRAHLTLMRVDANGLVWAVGGHC